MYEKKNVNYKAIFVNDGDKESMQFSTVGDYSKGEKTVLNFEHEGLKISVSYKGKHIYLKNNHSYLHLNMDQMTSNDYQLPYGSVELKTKVIMFEESEKHIKLKYELYDSQALISTVYILITMSDIVDELEIC